MFSSLRHIHWCVAFCAINRLAPWLWYTTGLDRPPSVDSRHQSIAGYRPTIVFVAARHHSVHSMRYSQILAQNCDFCLPHLHSTLPLEGFPSEYCHDVWFRKTRMVWLPDGEKILKTHLVYSFWHNTRTWRTHTHTHRERHRMTAKAATA